MPDTRTTLLILAAGVGRRYGGLKQLESVGPGGEAFLEYSIFDALRAGFDRIVLVIRPETEAEFQTALGGRLDPSIKLSYAYQRLTGLPQPIGIPAVRTKPWGTGQAVLAAEDKIDGPFAVVNADDFYGAGAFAALCAFLKAVQADEPPTFALAGFSVGHTLPESGQVTRALCRADDNGWLERVFEVLKLEKNGHGARYTDSAGAEQQVSADTLVSMNIWGFTPAVFAELRRRFHQFLATTGNGSSEYLLPDIVQAMIADGSARVRVIRHDGVWCGITVPEDLEPARRFIAGLVERGDYPSRLWG